METVDPKLLKEIDEEKPDTPVGLLSDEQKDTLIERAFLGLYRWYVQRSQTKRNWNPDFDFDWRKFRTDHTAKLNTILEGFFAVEQYVPDYVFTLLRVIRKSHGRSHFHIRWGSEEEKHAELWENTLLFSRFRTPKWIEDYKHALREKEWELPWDCPIHMIFYTVVQERATQVNYLNTGLIARGKSKHAEFKESTDEVLARVAQTIAIDEAAHYNFFLEGARLYMYYYPTKAIEALHNVIKFFAMPAGDLIPGYDKFAEVVSKANVYGRREHMKDVLDVALDNLGIAGRRALFQGIERIRKVPDENGDMRHTGLFDLLDYEGVESKVKRLFGRISDYEKEVGFDLINPTEFIPSGLKA
ncbi:MAG: acyl-ACP desaturase [Calditrichia bacterium]